MYSKKCPKCGLVNKHRKTIDGVDYCNNCRTPLPKNDKQSDIKRMSFTTVGVK